jgi:hypothetical protein
VLRGGVESVIEASRSAEAERHLSPETLGDWLAFPRH